MRLRLDGRMRGLLRLLPRTNAYSLAELLLLAVLAAQCARLIWALVTPVGPLGDWRPREPVVPSDIRGTLSGFDPFFRSAPAAGPAAVTSLQLTLFGIRLDGASGARRRDPGRARQAAAELVGRAMKWRPACG